MKLYNAVLTLIVTFTVVACILLAAGSYSCGDYDISYKYIAISIIALIIFRLAWKDDKKDE